MTGAALKLVEDGERLGRINFNTHEGKVVNHVGEFFRGVLPEVEEIEGQAIDRAYVAERQLARGGIERVVIGFGSETGGTRTVMVNAEEAGPDGKPDIELVQGSLAVALDAEQLAQVRLEEAVGLPEPAALEAGFKPGEDGTLVFERPRAIPLPKNIPFMLTGLPEVRI